MFGYKYIVSAILLLGSLLCINPSFAEVSKFTTTIPDIGTYMWNDALLISFQGNKENKDTSSKRYSIEYAQVPSLSKDLTTGESIPQYSLIDTYRIIGNTYYIALPHPRIGETYHFRVYLIGENGTNRVAYTAFDVTIPPYSPKKSGGITLTKALRTGSIPHVMNTNSLYNTLGFPFSWDLSRNGIVRVSSLVQSSLVQSSGALLPIGTQFIINPLFHWVNGPLSFAFQQEYRSVNDWIIQKSTDVVVDMFLNSAPTEKSTNTTIAPATPSPVSLTSSSSSSSSSSFSSSSSNTPPPTSTGSTSTGSTNTGSTSTGSTSTGSTNTGSTSTGSTSTGSTSTGSSSTGSSTPPPPPPPPPPTNYTLSVVPTGSGTLSSSPVGISCGSSGSSCSTLFLSGTLVTLTPTADSGSTFTGWNGACTGTGACTVNMTQAQTVGATFVVNSMSSTLVPTATGTMYCMMGLDMSQFVDMTYASPDLPNDMGATYSPSEVIEWRNRMNINAYATGGDIFSGSPDDLTQIKKMADLQISTPEAPQDLTSTGPTLIFGFQTRNAAFMYLLTRNLAYRDAAKQSLLAFFSSQNNLNTVFNNSCFRELNGTAPMDAYYRNADTISRLATAYDYLRQGLSQSERLIIENGLRRYAYFFASHIDYSIGNIFPQRLSDNYLIRAKNSDINSGYPTYHTKKYDTNGDCIVDNNDDPTSYDVYTHTNQDGSLGNRISVVSLYFNNRRSGTVKAIALIGGVLDDNTLIGRASRYVKEWLTYAVYPDGSEGEYERNGDYCIPQQGRIYATRNIDTALTAADIMSRRGDISLSIFSTTDGLFGTNGGLKSINSYLATYFSLLGRQINRYMYEPWKTTQEPREATHMGNTISRYHNGPPVYTWHDLTFLVYATKMGKQQWIDAILRADSSNLPLLTTPPLYRDSGVRAFGTTGNTDIASILPSVLFMYGPTGSMINGSCGSSDKGSFSAPPTMHLCSAGSPDSMTGTTSWSWSCKGIGGGTNMSCGADHTPGIPVGSYTPSYTSIAYYVDQTLGNDANSGTILSPWKTLAKAKTAVLSPGDALLLKCGETWREGFAPTSTFAPMGNVLIGAYGNCSDTSRPTIKGSDVIMGSWMLESSSGTSMYSIPQSLPVSQVFASGTFLKKARYPNYGGIGNEYHLLKAATGLGTVITASDEDRIVFATNDPTGATIYIRSEPWYIETNSVIAYNSTNGEITLGSPLHYPAEAGDGYVLENQKWMLDSPGEWFMDNTGSKLYISMPDNSSPTSSLIEASTRANVFNPQSLSNLRIEHIGVEQDSQNGIYVQSNTGMLIRDIISTHNAITNLRIDNSSQIIIENSEFSHAQERGVFIKDTSNDSITIRNNRITHTGLSGNPGYTVTSVDLNASNSIITNNTIEQSAYIGIMFTNFENVQIIGNHIENMCMRLSDCAAIYTWNGYGTRNPVIWALISKNVIIGAHGNPEGEMGGGGDFAAGIYLDHTTNHVRIIDNMISDTSVGINFTWAKDNIVSGNKTWKSKSAGFNAMGPAGKVIRNTISNNVFFAADYFMTDSGGTINKVTSYGESWNVNVTPEVAFSGADANIITNNRIVSLSDIDIPHWNFGYLTPQPLIEWQKLGTTDTLIAPIANREALVLSSGPEMIVNGTMDSSGASWSNHLSASGSLTFGNFPNCTGMCARLFVGAPNDYLRSVFTVPPTASGTLYHLKLSEIGGVNGGGVGNVMLTSPPYTPIGFKRIFPHVSQGEKFDIQAFFLSNGSSTGAGLFLFGDAGSETYYDNVSLVPVTSYEFMNPYANSAHLINESGFERTYTCLDVGLISCDAYDDFGTLVSWPITLPARSSMILLSKEVKWLK